MSALDRHLGRGELANLAGVSYDTLSRWRSWARGRDTGRPCPEAAIRCLEVAAEIVAGVLDYIDRYERALVAAVDCGVATTVARAVADDLGELLADAQAPDVPWVRELVRSILADAYESALEDLG